MRVEGPFAHSSPENKFRMGEQLADRISPRLPAAHGIAQEIAKPGRCSAPPLAANPE
jgi:hypothetical protein